MNFILSAKCGQKISTASGGLVFPPQKAEHLWKMKHLLHWAFHFFKMPHFILFHFFPLIPNGYMFHEKNITNSASALHRVIPSKQGVSQINSCAYWLIWMLRNLNWITESFNFELWFEQRLFNSFINQQPYFYKGPLNQ